jgi:hypothetical protein
MDMAMTWSRSAMALTFVLMVHGLLHLGEANAAKAEATEYELKAAFLFNFAGYVTWPQHMAPADQPMRFGVVGAHELAGHLEAMGAVRQINGRAVQVERIADTRDVPSLHVLFISREFTDFTSGMLALAKTNSVLTVTEHTFMPADSVINFRVIDGRIRFDVNLSVAEEAQLSVSSRLLQVARRVIGVRR